MARTAGLPGQGQTGLRRRELNYPTLHGVVVRRAYAAEHPEVLDAFLLPTLWEDSVRTGESGGTDGSRHGGMRRR